MLLESLADSVARCSALLLLCIEFYHACLGPLSQSIVGAPILCFASPIDLLSSAGEPCWPLPD